MSDEDAGWADPRVSTVPGDHFRFAHDDAAYLFGALDPAERAAYEEHLDRCPACTRAVDRLRTTVAALDAVPDLAEHHLAPEEPPAQLLPDLLARAAEERRRGRRRATRVVSALAGVAVAALVAAGVAVAVDTSGPARPPVAAGRAMTPAGSDVLVRATAALHPVGWGTRITLHCRYDGNSPYHSGAQPAVRYGLRVVDTAGRTHDLGSWSLRYTTGAEATFSSGTSLAAGRIRSVEIVRYDGTPVLRLHP